MKILVKRRNQVEVNKSCFFLFFIFNQEKPQKVGAMNALNFQEYR